VPLIERSTLGSRLTAQGTMVADWSQPVVTVAELPMAVRWLARHLVIRPVLRSGQRGPQREDTGRE